MKRFTLIAAFLALVIFVTACGPPSGTPFSVSLVQADPNDPASMVNAFFVARSAFNTDAALQYVNDSTVINSEGTYTGTGQIRDFIQNRADANIQFEVTNPQVNGDQVTFTLIVYQNGQEINQLNGQATVQNGVIVSLDEGM